MGDHAARESQVRDEELLYHARGMGRQGQDFGRIPEGPLPGLRGVRARPSPGVQRQAQGEGQGGQTDRDPLRQDPHAERKKGGS